MATYTENYNLKMPSGQDAPDVEDFNTNAEIIDTVLKAHSDNTADEYSPDETYTAGRLVIQNNALWKAKQDINVAEAWTPEHWEGTTLAAEFSAVNSRLSTVITTDLNNIKTHICGYTASNTPNRPDGLNGYFECFTSGESDPAIVFQRYTTYGTHNVYIRWLERGSSWGDWMLDE